ncbi:hypothetical protein ILUMI_18737, partial [Ignelater luminosus]
MKYKKSKRWLQEGMKQATKAFKGNAMGWLMASERFNHWLKEFRERNSNISLRAPGSTSAARARAFNKPQVMIYNMDESGLSTCCPKAPKGKKHVNAITSTERGEHVTVVDYINAFENFLPPALIMPRKNYKTEYFDSARRTLWSCAMSMGIRW